MSSSLTISVITICYNNLDELIQTIESVNSQTDLPFEHIIIDGSSNTAIYEFLLAAPETGYRKWISEPDRGIADAFNKGLAMATGEVVNMLNSGDRYFDNSVIQQVRDEFESNPDVSWMHGKMQLQRGGIWVTVGKAFDPALLYRGMRSISHQSMFVKKKLHDLYGMYDISLKNAMDYDFVCRIAREPFIFVPYPFVVFAPGGTTDKDYFQALEEGRKVYERHFGKSVMLDFWQTRLKLLRYMLDGPAGKWLYKLKVWLKLENA